MSTRFNSQIAELALNKELCDNIYYRMTVGQSIRHIARTHNITQYAVVKLFEYMERKDEAAKSNNQ